MTCDFNELFRLCRIIKAFETLVISIAVDKELDLFRKPVFQTYEKGIADQKHQNSERHEKRDFLKGREDIVEKGILIGDGEKRNRIQVNHGLQ